MPNRPCTSHSQSYSAVSRETVASAIGLPAGSATRPCNVIARGIRTMMPSGPTVSFAALPRAFASFGSLVGASPSRFVPGLNPSPRLAASSLIVVAGLDALRLGGRNAVSSVAVGPCRLAPVGPTGASVPPFNGATSASAIGSPVSASTVLPARAMAGLEPDDRRLERLARIDTIGKHVEAATIAVLRIVDESTEIATRP